MEQVGGLEQALLLPALVLIWVPLSGQGRVGAAAFSAAHSANKSGPACGWLGSPSAGMAFGPPWLSQGLQGWWRGSAAWVRSRLAEGVWQPLGVVDQLVRVPDVGQAKPEEDPLLVGEAAIAVFEVPGGGGRQVLGKTSAHYSLVHLLRTYYRHTSFYCASLYCALQVLRFFTN